VHWILSVCLSLSLSLSLSLNFNGRFPGEPGLAGYTEAKDDGSSGDNWSYKTCKAPVRLLPPTNQHPTFYRPNVLHVIEVDVKNLMIKWKTVWFVVNEEN